MTTDFLPFNINILPANTFWCSILMQSDAFLMEVALMQFVRYIQIHKLLMYRLHFDVSIQIPFII